MHPHERHILVLIGGDYFRIDLFLSRQPAGQLAFLEFARFGENQAVGVHDGAECHGGAVHVELHDGIAGLFGDRGKGAQGLLAVAIAVPCERGRRGRFLRAGKLRQQGYREDEGKA